MCALAWQRVCVHELQTSISSELRRFAFPNSLSLPVRSTSVPAACSAYTSLPGLAAPSPPHRTGFVSGIWVGLPLAEEETGAAGLTSPKRPCGPGPGPGSGPVSCCVSRSGRCGISEAGEAGGHQATGQCTGDSEMLTFLWSTPPGLEGAPWTNPI